VHIALIAPILIAGVERRFAILEGALLAVLLLGVGPQLLTIALSLLLAFGVHPLLRAAAKRDPQAFDLYIRSLRFQSFYPAQAHPLAPTLARPLFQTP
jgi:type IV secretory pathway TrbD component